MHTSQCHFQFIKLTPDKTSMPARISFSGSYLKLSVHGMVVLYVGLKLIPATCNGIDFILLFFDDSAKVSWHSSCVLFLGALTD